MRKKRNRIISKPVLYIACEGTSSEFQYFESWAQTDVALEHFERIEVYPNESEKRPKTTPYELFVKAKNQIETRSANFAWIVFDKDLHPKLPETFKQASVAGVSIAFSSRSFEEWVMLHFEKNTTIFNATECKDLEDKPINCGSNIVPNCTPINCLTGHIRRQNFIPEYSKKKKFDLYSAIVNKTEIAIVNSAWLRYKANASLYQQQPFLHNLNPYSNVDQLILGLHNRTDKVEWGASGQNILLNNWTLSASLHNSILTVRVSHAHHNAILLKDILSCFFTTNDKLNNHTCDYIDSSYTVNNNHSNNQIMYNGDVIEYHLKHNNQPYFLFFEDTSNTRIYIEI